MANNIQDVFTAGELSPKMYGRVTTKPYFRGLRDATNILPSPQGGTNKRFGTVHWNTLVDTDWTQIEPIEFPYLNQCIYIVILADDTLYIYLEGRLVATVNSTGIDVEEFLMLDNTILEERLRVSSWFFQPKDLVRSADAANAITGVNVDPTNTIAITNPLTLDIILPAEFTTTGTLPTTEPQIKSDRIYFIRAITTSTIAVYSSAVDAYYDRNRYTVSAAGTGTNNLVTQNNWTFGAVSFRNVPTYDFTGGYDAITFTPAATSGSTTLTASAAIFTAEMVGGIYDGGGGTARITGFTSTTQVSIDVINTFDSTAAVSGRLVSLREPAWSNTRGWPRVCSSFSNRAIFANSPLLPNGLWASVVNDYDDFDDSKADPSDAISWYPTSDTANSIEFITPYKSLVIHSTAGAMSTPMNDSLAVTPENFVLTLQDDTPATNIQPVTIDNQIFTMSGKHMSSLIWNESYLGYQSTVVSNVNEHLITDPISMAAFRAPGNPGGRYVFITNRDGTLAMYQTLLSEEISGMTPAEMQQDYGTAKFRYVMADKTSRCWFIVEREIAEAGATYDIDGFNATDNTLLATGSALSETVPIAVLFATADTLPTTAPQITATQYYWALAVSGANIKIYPSQEQALANENQIQISSAGSMATVQIFPLSTKLMLEELSFDVKTDCTVVTSGAARDTLTGLGNFNAQQPAIKADGKVWDQNPIIGGEIDVTIVGDTAEVENSQVGFNVESVITPLAQSLSTGNTIQSSNLARPKHNRQIALLFENTIGGRVNNQNIALTKLRVGAFNVPEPATGFMHITTMSGWDDFNKPAFTITHRDPYDFSLLGIFYDVEV